MKDIRCLCCGGPVYAWRDNISEEVFIECENDDERGPCGARWSGNGELLLPPISERDKAP